MLLRCLIVAGCLIAGHGARAQEALPPGTTLAEAAAQRFPQPVLVGDLIGRWVLRPLPSQPVLGVVRGVVKQTDGSIEFVLDYGGLSGVLFARQIAVPVDAMALAGQYMEVLFMTPEQLNQFKTFDSAGTTPLPADSIIRVGLNGPSH